MDKGNIFLTEGFVERQAPGDGATVTPLTHTRNYIIDTVALLALTINMPTNPLDGQPFSIFSTEAIAALTLVSAITIVNDVTSLTALTRVQFNYNRTGNKWYRTA